MEEYIIPDKFEMGREMAEFSAKKYLKESVYRSARLEGMGVTFPQTEAIMENLAVAGVAPKEISKVCDLRDAWEYVLGHLEAEVDLKFLKDLHAIIAREDVPWEALGEFRTVEVRVTGSKYMPGIPKGEEILAEIRRILASPHETDRAISAGLYIMRCQPFLDGNKRVGTMVANRLLIADGRGIFSVPEEKTAEFSEKLVRFYESGEMGEIKKLIETECLTGMQ